MKKFVSVFLTLLLLGLPLSAPAQKGSFPDIKQLQSPQKPRLGFMIHGGAGVIRRGDLSPEREKEYRQKLEEAVLAGYKALREGRSGLDAIEIAIKIMEDSPLFNAGKGSVFTADGKNELDAAVMDGKTQNAGAVAGLHRVKNPIVLARAIMEKSPHVMMIGDGAELFAREMKIELVPEKYFWTQHRWDALQKRIRREKEKMNENPKDGGEKEDSGDKNQKTEKSGNMNPAPVTLSDREFRADKYGTVGAVALDKQGNLAAGTSTGGMTYKKYGRVGDVPIIGAGTYANNQTCAVSATGWGEYFIRLGVARDISSLMEYRAMPVQRAADLVIKTKLEKIGGDGGVIAIDKFGNMAISFNSEGMYRAYINSEGKPVVEIYQD